MNKLLVSCVVFIAHFAHVLLAREACTLPLSGEWEKYSPILLRNDSSVILPTRGVIHLEHGENVTVVCPDSKNYLQNTRSNITRVICEREDVVRVANKHMGFNKLQCKKLIRGQVVKTVTSCAENQARMYRLGYRFSKNHIYTLIEICYDETTGTTYFSKHLLHGSNLKGASNSNYRPTFSPEGAGSVSVSVAYKQIFQKSTFNKLLKSANLASKFINAKSYLARGHLSPDADFIIASMQHSTYYYINVSPQWQTINGGNWKKIESMVRKSAENMNDTYEIITGNHDVLELDDVNGRKVAIYLVSGNKLPVPKFVWKIVHSIKLKKAVVLVVLNNPFVHKITSSDYLCERNICSDYGWESSSWEEHSKGFVHCCDYNEFVDVVKVAPRISVSGILYA